MARKTPRVDRECLVCGTHFEGTPKATRCPTCREAGLKVPSAKQATRAKTRKCGACGERKPIEAYQHHDRFCDSCFEDLQFAPLSAEEEARLREEARKQRVKDRLARQAEWLDRREKAKPTGAKLMNKITAKTPVGILWKQIAAADGAAAQVMYTNTDLSEDEKVRLLTSFYRLRAKGFHPSAIARLCPVALMAEAAQDAITDLPVVEDAAADDEWTFDPLEGNECLRQELAEIADQRDRHDLQVRLGLVAATE